MSPDLISIQMTACYLGTGRFYMSWSAGWTYLSFSLPGNYMFLSFLLLFLLPPYLSFFKD